jgi:hypothetical protein
MKRKEIFSDHFDEGEFYHRVFRKDDGNWRIERLQLTITWTTGEDPTGVGRQYGEEDDLKLDDQGEFAQRRAMASTTGP